MASKISYIPADAQSLEHRQIGAGIRMVGIEQCSIPIEKHGASGKGSTVHSRWK
jgi:hypothetical protein